MKFLKTAVFILLFMPFVSLFYFYMIEDLTAEPVEYILHYTGIWSIRILLLTLLMTPLKNITKRVEFLHIRRTVGLFTFFYVSLHLFIYIGLDLGFRFNHLWQDIIKRPYITVGFAAWLILIPMALTSNKRMIRKLGKRWKTLHKSIYFIVVLACLHFLWLVKNDLREPLIYAAIAFILLFYRLIKFSKS